MKPNNLDAINKMDERRGKRLSCDIYTLVNIVKIILDDVINVLKVYL